MDPVNFRAVNSGLTRRWWAAEISQCWGQCAFTELPWKIAEPKGVSLDLALSLTSYLAQRSQTHPSLGLYLSFKQMYVKNNESVMDFSSGHCRPSWTFQPSSLKTSMTPLDSWGLFGSLLSSPFLLGKENEKDTKCTHSRTFIQSVNSRILANAKSIHKKMMRHQFSSNTGVIKKTINIYRANESKEITKCVFSNALLMWCLLCIYKQEQICLIHVISCMGWI